MEELEHTARMVSAGLMTDKEGTNEILKVLYTHKARFGLGRLDLDALHDFLLHEHAKLRRLLVLYRTESGFSFSGFLYSSIQRSLRIWRKRSARAAATEESAAQQHCLAYEESEYRYRQEEFASCCEPQAAFDSGLHRHSQEARQSAPLRTQTFRYNEKADKLRKAACLILALKSSYYLDYDIIKKVSKMTGIAEKKLASMVEEVNEGMRHKIIKHERCVRSRDTAFFFHRKYRRECSKLDSGSPLSRKTAQKYEKQTALWESRNEQLKTPLYSAVPSNRAVARILNIDDRKVASILQKARSTLLESGALSED